MRLLNRVNPSGRQYRLREIFGNPDKTSVHTGDNSMVLPISIQEMSDGWFLWVQSGYLIQDAFPRLDPEQRDFLITGWTPEDVKKAFPREVR